ITGMSRDVIWGFYIAQFTFLVGVAASAVMVVLPYYLHNYKEFGRITILGEFLAVAAVTMCMLNIFVDMGQPLRAMNIVLHPTPNSVMFWDMIALTGYLLLNVVIGWTTLDCERNGVPPPKWVKPLIYLSIPWAVSIHTVTAFLYCGLPGRHYWLTAILAPRFLASAFASGPALLVLLCLVVRRVSKFDPGRPAIQNLAVIVVYAAIINVFFVLLEFFTAYYSGVPGHRHGLQYLFFGFEGHAPLVPWMWLAACLAVAAILILLSPDKRQNETLLAIACAMVFVSTWIDKGLGLLMGGFAITPLETVASYRPTVPEVLISVGIYAIGALVLTLLYKIAVSVKEEPKAV
ncbi:polysulfide reductase NrfD, partial [Candidatus Sumerlaeota bacterium]|nr:polysulfide reductase NrfD [Candidatus Sumerlaeota bacterium]